MVTHEESILVLMSTYNGENYIKEQLDSILQQEGVRLSIYIRDDGSTDSTPFLLKQYAEKYPCIKVDLCKNIGWRASFSELLINAEQADFYCFSDQDDYWMPNKLERALTLMRSHKEVPCLYRGRSEIADGNLVRKGELYQDTAIPNKIRGLFQNYCQGCTLVFNKMLRELYLRHPIPTVSHDIWLPLIALETGIVVDDPNPYMLYRVHEANASATNSVLNIWKRRLDGILARSKSNYTYNFGETLFQDYAEMLDEDTKLVCWQLSVYKQNFGAKWSLLWNREVRGTKFLRTVMVKWFILTNQYQCDV